MIADALTRKALPRENKAMFTRSARGFGLLGAPILAMVAFLWLKLNGCARCPDLRLLREAGRQSRPESIQQRHHDRYIPGDRYILGIYPVYIEKKRVLNKYWPLPVFWAFPFSFCLH